MFTCGRKNKPLQNFDGIIGLSLRFRKAAHAQITTAPRYLNKQQASDPLELHCNNFPLKYYWW